METPRQWPWRRSTAGADSQALKQTPRPPPPILRPVKTAVITGAGRGLGRAIAGALSQRGITVHVTDVDGDAARTAAAEIGAGAFHSHLDVRDEEACRAVADATVMRTGALDIWVNNAGVLATGLSWEHDAETRGLMMDVNAIGTMNGTVAALGPMREAGSGHVINVVSLAGIVAAPGEVNYAASKHAAMAFSLGTQYDLSRAGHRRIRVSALCPDGIWTPMLHDRLADPDAAGSFSGTLLRPERVAAAVTKLVNRPKMVTVVPRWRGPVLRLFDAFPGLGLRLLPLVLADARRRQATFRRRADRGETLP